MARPSRSRKICTIPKYKIFAAVDDREDDAEKGQNKANETEVTRVTLNLDEYEAIRMIDYLGRTHEQCAVHMGISRTTVTEIYERARYKLSDMLINGKSLYIDGGSVSVCGGGNCCAASCGTPDANACGESCGI